MTSATTAIATRREPPTPLGVRDVFRENAAFVLRTVRRLGVRPADVEDAAQEVFLVVHRKLDQYDGICSIRSWLFGIATRVASDHRRRAHVRRETASDEAPEAPISADQEERAMRSQEREMLDRALDEIDDAKREVFVLHDLEQLPMAEVAEAVGCPLQTAYSRLHAARARVRSAIERMLADRRSA